MLTIIISIIAGLIAGFSLSAAWQGHPVWAWTVGVLVFFAINILINLWLKKRLEAIFNGVQKHLTETQDRLRRKINMMQSKLQGGPKLQASLEAEQNQSVLEAIGMLDQVAPLKKWNLLAGRQADTLKAQLYYQLKDFAAADPLLDKALIMDPSTLCMRMAREYKRGMMDKVEKSFKKGVKRFKDEKGTLVYALYSWILVNENRIDEAVVVLDEGKDSTENPVLKQNWEHLVNGRAKRFSNAPLGDLWYSLQLEQPKMIRSYAQSPYAGGGMGLGGGKRHFR